MFGKIVPMFLPTLLAASAMMPCAEAAGPAGAVYVASNAPSSNSILVFHRSARGRLSFYREIPTGGLGTGSGLGNQGGLALDDARRRLYAINAGSDSISAFEIRPFGLRPLVVTPSGGARPVSIAVHGRLLYVLHAGVPNGIAGFRIRRGGSLDPIPGSARSLSSGAVGPAEIAFSPDGAALVVTEKATNLIALFPVDAAGVAGDPAFLPSPGATPFGFAFGEDDQLFVSEAFGGAPGTSAVSSYRLDDDRTLEPVDPSVATKQSAACWVVVTRDGRFVYTTNTGSDTLSAFRIADDGRLLLLDEDGVAADTDAGPIDMDLTPNGRLLYVLNGAGRSITAYHVAADGSLENRGSIGGIPAGANGLVAR